MKVFKGINFAGQASAPSSPANGDTYYDTTLQKLRCYQNGAWVNLSDSDGTVLLSDGSAASPSLAFINSTATGLYRVGADSLGFSANGVNVGQYSSAGLWTLGASGGTQTHVINGGVSVSLDSSFSGHLNILGQKELRLQDTTGGEYVGHRAPGTVTSSHTYTWPAALPAGNRILQSDTSGNLSWVVAGAGSGDISNGGNSFGSAITIGTNDAFALNFETNAVTKGSVSSAGLWTLGESGGTQTHVVNGRMNITTPAGTNPALILTAVSTTTPFVRFTDGTTGYSIGNTTAGTFSIDVGTGVGPGSDPRFSVTQAGLVTIGASGGTQSHVINGNAHIPSGNLRVGTTGLVSAGVEQLSVLQTVQAADTASSHATTTIRTNNTQGACSLTMRNFLAINARTTTADTTDSGILTNADLFLQFTPSAGTTYTNSNRVSQLVLNGPQNLGAGSLAISIASGIRFNTNSANSGTRKIAINFAAWSGATNNAYIADNEAFTGDWFINSTSTAQTRINGSVGLGGIPAATMGLRVAHVGLTGVEQIGINIDATAASDAVTTMTGVSSGPSTANSAFTCSLLMAFNAVNRAKGAASTVTRHTMYHGATPTQGTNNAFIADNSSYTGNWFINSTSNSQTKLGNFYFNGNSSALPTGFDVETAFLRTDGTGSAPFDQAGSLVIRPRVSSTAGRSSVYIYTGSPSTLAFTVDEVQRITIGATSSAAVHVVNGGMRHTVRSISGATTLDTTTTDYIVLANSSSAGFTITLPAATSGRKLIIKDSGGSAQTNNITISPASGTIDGASTFVLNNNYQSVDLVSDGTNWFIC